jgi:hypothetical protein
MEFIINSAGSLAEHIKIPVLFVWQKHMLL